MPPYLSPGVYVEEVPSAVKAIAAVSTSTAGFIGIVPDELVIPVELVTDRTIGTGNGARKDFNLPVAHYPVRTASGSFQIRANGEPVSDAEAKLNLNDTAPALVQFHGNVFAF